MKADQIFQFMQTPEKLNRDTLPFLKELTERYPAFEAGWILYLKNLKNLNDSSFEQELIIGALRIQDRRKLYLFLNQKARETRPEQYAPTELSDENDPDIYKLMFPTKYRLENPEKDEEINSDTAGSDQHNLEKKYKLIEKFLEAQPKMPHVKEEESDTPKESHLHKVEEDDDFVTETLATIYARQGYYKKAIQIFEKLSLKYPEKIPYFAAQIEKIKNLMNN